MSQVALPSELFGIISDLKTRKMLLEYLTAIGNDTIDFAAARADNRDIVNDIGSYMARDENRDIVHDIGAYTVAHNTQRRFMRAFDLVNEHIFDTCAYDRNGVRRLIAYIRMKRDITLFPKVINGFNCEYNEDIVIDDDGGESYFKPASPECRLYPYTKIICGQYSCTATFADDACKISKYEGTKYVKVDKHHAELNNVVAQLLYEDEELSPINDDSCAESDDDLLNIAVDCDLHKLMFDIICTYEFDKRRR
jgi:hypothetical protein